MENDFENNPLIESFRNTSDNIFLTGAGGTGKSYILKQFKEWLQERGSERSVIFTAPTGIAALNIGGVTLHSALGIGIAKSISEVHISNYKLKNLKKIFNNITTIVIDEISFVNESLFNLVNDMLKRITNNVRLMGGKRLIVVGDFLQLPPIIQNDAEQNFVFNSPLWKRLNFKTIHLTEIKRQDNKMFSDILGKIRQGNIDKEVKEFLVSLYKKQEPNDDLLRLVGTNALANNINAVALAKIPTQSKTIDPKIDIMDKNTSIEIVNRIQEYFDNNVMVDVPLVIKKEARVIITKNCYTEDYILFNGDFGTIIDFTDDLILVYIDRLDEEIELVRSIWEKKKLFTNEKNEVVSTNEATYTQFPLKLAYAITVHKSQGMTFSGGVIFPKSFFDLNHFYVAISRFSNHENLYIKDLPNSNIITSKDAVEFYKKLTR